jgi:N-methylhydantoinase A
VTATLSLPSYSVAEYEAGGESSRQTGRVFVDGDWHDAAVVERDGLASGARLTGPTVVSQMDSTVLLLPGDEAHVDDYGNLHIERQR